MLRSDYGTENLYYLNPNWPFSISMAISGTVASCSSMGNLQLTQYCMFIDGTMLLQCKNHSRNTIENRRTVVSDVDCKYMYTLTDSLWSLGTNAGTTKAFA